MPDNDAINQCLEILESFQFSNICIEFLGKKHDIIQRNCVEDVKVNKYLLK